MVKRSLKNKQGKDADKTGKATIMKVIVKDRQVIQSNQDTRQESYGVSNF
jgi:hypothetical protein